MKLALSAGDIHGDSCGNSEQCETPQRGTSEEARGSPAESEVYINCGGNTSNYAKAV